MHIILTGATGAVGSAVLEHCLRTSSITKVSILSRRAFTLPDVSNTTDSKDNANPLDITKAHVIVHGDYNTYPEELLNDLKGADGCVWAQGISQNQVAKDEYIKITHDYPVAAAKSFASLSSTGKFNFVYVSGEGADPTEKTFTLFGKIKGRTEAELLALPATSTSTTPPTSPSPYSALRIFNVRPGYVDPSFPTPTLFPGSSYGRPVSKRLVDGLLAPALRTFVPSQVSPTKALAKVLVDLACGDGEPLDMSAGGIEAGGRTVRSAGVRRLGEA